MAPKFNPKVRNWCFTLNNYDETELVSLRQCLSQKTTEKAIRYSIFAQEVGEQGTPHLQGYISFSLPQRLSAVKKVVGNRAHAVVSKGTEEDNVKYCSKGEQPKDEWNSKGSTGPNYGLNSKVEEFGTRRVFSGKRNDLEAFKEAVLSGIIDKETLYTEHSAVCAKYPRFVKDFISFQVPEVKVEDHSSSFREWQQRCLDIIDTPPDPRKIIFVVDTPGDAGKSWFASWLEQEKAHVQVMKPGKIADMAYDYDEFTYVFILDCPRSKQGDFIQYDFLENIKDGRLFSPKYESRTKRFKPPHVFVFMNEEPDYEKLSENRYYVIDQDNNVLGPSPPGAFTPGSNILN